jgi:addiction module HigA family antidote
VTDLIPPGWYVKQWLQTHHMTQKELAAALGYKEPFISKLVNLHTHITIRLALKLEKITDTAAATWMTYETNYQLALARRAVA